MSSSPLAFKTNYKRLSLPGTSRGVMLGKLSFSLQTPFEEHARLRLWKEVKTVTVSVREKKTKTNKSFGAKELLQGG